MEWSLADPILLESIDDAKGSWKTNPRRDWDPFEHQIDNLLTFCRKLPAAVLADDVGLGKTISAGLILSELVARGRVKRCLVICPKILGDQWCEELRTKFGIAASTASGAELRRQVAAVGSAGPSALVTTYHSATRVLGETQPGRFEMVIFDEAHKLRNLYGSPKPPKMALAVREALQRRLFPFMLLLTATPMQNRIWDLYSLVDLLAAAEGKNNPFGEFTQFQTKYLLDSKGLRLDPRHKQAFDDVLRRNLRRTRRVDVSLIFPTRNITGHLVPPGENESFMEEFLREHHEELTPLERTSLAQAAMSSPQALARQVGNSSLPELRSRHEELRERVEREPQSAKLKALLKIVRQLAKQRPDDWRLVVFTTRKATQEAIWSALKEKKVEAGLILSGHGEVNRRNIAAYNGDEHDGVPQLHVLISTDAGAEGVNLQAGNVLINFDLPWNPMIVEQRIGRIQRLGSRHATVEIINLMVRDSVEAQVVGKLMQKIQSVNEAVGDIESILEAGDDEDGTTFEAKVRQLVDDSLRGKNVAHALAMETQSIETARQKYQEGTAVLDAAMRGTRGEVESDAAPKLGRPKPSMSSRALVEERHQALGHRVDRVGDELLKVTEPGRESRWLRVGESSSSGDERVLGRLPQDMRPGGDAFRRLCESLRETGGHLTKDRLQASESLALPMVRQWVADEIGGHVTVLGVEVIERTPKFAGNLTFRVEAYNGVDRYETLVSSDIGAAEAIGKLEKTKDDDPLITQELDPRTLGAATLGHEIEADSNVAKFVAFYQNRHGEAMRRATSSHERSRATGDFEPRVKAEAVAFDGVRHGIIVLRATLRLDDVRNTSVTFRLVSTSRDFDQTPAVAVCKETDRLVPTSLLARCCLTDDRVCKHLLVTSDLSKRVARPGRTGVCDRSGRTLLDDELERLPNGSRIAKDLAGRCAVSGAVVEADALATCDFTGATVLPQHLLMSDLSDRRFISTEAATCAHSGRVGHASELIACAVTGKPLDPAVAVTSAVSGKLASPDALVRCPLTNKDVLPAELVQCSMTGLRALPEALEKCAETNDWVVPDRLETCAVTGKQVRVDRLVSCEVTGRRALPQALKQCVLTGKKALPEALDRCAATDRWAIPEGLETCAVTDKRVLPDQLQACDETGLRALPSALLKSVVSGLSVVPNELTACEITGEMALPRELQQCDYTGKKVLPRLLVTSPVSQRQVLEEEAVRCEITGEAVVPGELRRCVSSGRDVLPRLLEASELSGKEATAEHFRTCEATGRRLLLDEVDTCQITMDLVGVDQLVASDLSGKRGQQTLMARCAASGRHALPDELEVCFVSQKQVDPKLLRLCHVSGRRALPEVMERCAETLDLAIASELRTCDLTQRRVRPDLLAVCTVTNQRVLRDRLVSSDLSGRLMLATAAVRSVDTGRHAHPDECSICPWSQTTVPADELAADALTGVKLRRSLLDDQLRSKALMLLAERPEAGDERQHLKADLVRPLADQHGRIRVIHAIDSPGDLVAVRVATSNVLRFKKTVLLGYLRLDHNSVSILGQIKSL